MSNRAELTKILAACYRIAGDILANQENTMRYPYLYDTVFCHAAGMHAALNRAQDEYFKDAHDTTAAKQAKAELLQILSRIQETEYEYLYQQNNDQ